MDLVTYALAKKYADQVATGSSVSVPSKTSDLQNDSGFITDTQANTKVNAHNTNTSAHSDIRNLITALTTRLNALADSDDTTLDQMSEVVAYIKNNKSLIDGITTSKVNIADIVNNLTSNVSNKPLSAAQGVVLKGLIDTLTSSKVSTTELDTAVNSALATAKASGDFKGDKGEKGKDGTSITVSKVEESTADGGSNVVTFSDGKTVTIKNGSKGSTGDTGATGAKGADGKAGTNGTSVTAIELTKDVDGNITGGTATLSDSSTIVITVTTAETSE